MKVLMKASYYFGYAVGTINAYRTMRRGTSESEGKETLDDGGERREKASRTDWWQLACLLVTVYCIGFVCGMAALYMLCGRCLR